VIRINLLPHKRPATGAPQASQKWLLVVLGVVLLEIVGLFLIYQSTYEDLQRQKQKNAQIKSQIDEINRLIADHEQIKKALVILRAREEAIAKLQAGRSGPTAVLLELAQVMTTGKGPTADPDKLAKMRQDNPLAVYNPAWDTRRLWLTQYVEGQRTVRLEGMARDGNDVYELAQRLKLSPYFYEVTLLPGKKEVEAATKLDLVSFALQFKVRY
jgi:type IV pilus assembly protein PilN